ncbi:MAG: hypothetical protein LC731_07860, partial [Acidobacteria bacterium]|nr:hypothetical protein [Acidobacteriota bacterium]
VRNKVMQWKVRCDCGTEKVVDGHALKQGLTQSCGCLQRERASAVRKKAAKEAARNQGRFSAPVRTRAERLEDLPQEYGCNLCGEIKPLDEMVVVFMKREQCYRLRPRCKKCHNERERGHRREWKQMYLRRWRARNEEKTKSYWKDRPDYLERSRRGAARYVERHRDGLAIRRRFKTRGVEVSVAEAEALLKKFGPCYPTRHGLTPEGLKRCEQLRSEHRRAGRAGLISLFEIRIKVYDEGMFIEPHLQARPFQKTSTRMRAWQAAQREKKEAKPQAA